MPTSTPWLLRYRESHQATPAFTPRAMSQLVPVASAAPPNRKRASKHISSSGTATSSQARLLSRPSGAKKPGPLGSMPARPVGRVGAETGIGRALLALAGGGAEAGAVCSVHVEPDQ